MQWDEYDVWFGWCSCGCMFGCVCSGMSIMFGLDGVVVGVCLDVCAVG